MVDQHINAGLFTATYFTVATLPAAASFPGERYTVTDATVNNAIGRGAVVSGGGTNKTKVVSDGTNWRID